MKEGKWNRWKIIRVIWVVFGLTFLGWMFYSVNADVEDDIFEDSSKIKVDITSDYISFTPKTSFDKVMFFYPGALVDPDAYAPLCRKIAENGLQVLIIYMPWRMAIFGYNKIKELNLLADKSKQYILAGHSQGGKMAAQFVYENPGLIDQLILLATTHPRDYDLSNSTIPVMKIFGSQDGVADPQDILANKSLLPKNTMFVEIEGANHAQFGYYGSQLGDNEAQISREKQQKIVLQNILWFIQANDHSDKSTEQSIEK